MAHLKRKFHDAVTALPNGKKSGSAVEGEAYCEKLFQLERTFANLSPEERRLRRQELARPILDEFCRGVQPEMLLPSPSMEKGNNFSS